MSSPNPQIYDLSPYEPGLPVELVVRRCGISADDVVKLASNENPLGPSPKAVQALHVAQRTLHRYPEPYPLTQALARLYDVDPAMVVLGNGSNDVLDLIARVYLGPGDESVSSAYAFIVYRLVTQAMGATNVITQATGHYGHDFGAMLAAITPATKIVWIANPNNPSGTFLPYNQIHQFLKQVPPTVMVVVDEAYYEYLCPADRIDSVAWLQEFSNLILVRTFSKIYGLAGLRLGYGIASPEIVNFLNRVRQPFNVNSGALAAGVAALDDIAFVEQSYAANLASREQLIQGLGQLGLTYLPAYGNFVTFTVDAATEMSNKLLSKGIIVRPLVGYGMPEWLRVTAGLPEDNYKFLSMLAQILS